MTTEEAIERLKNIWIRDALQEDYDALDMAIKALEQEPCCEQIKWERDMAIAQLKELGYGLGEKPKGDVLDKIRAEIEDLDRFYDNDYFSTNNCPMYKCNEVLLIIDKYREREGE